jgi:hypothetical protein
MGSVIRFRVASGRQLRSMCMFKYQFVLLHRMCMCMMAGRKRKDAGVADRPGKGRHRDNCWFLLQLQKVCWCLLVFARVARSMMQAFARVCCILLHVLLIDGKSPSVLKGDFQSKCSKTYKHWKTSPAKHVKPLITNNNCNTTIRHQRSEMWGQFLGRVERIQPAPPVIRNVAG